MKVPPEPAGSISDPKSKIYPWKRTEYTVIGDAATDKSIYIKSGVYAVTGDPGRQRRRARRTGSRTTAAPGKGSRKQWCFP